jgi:hypothetical protein
VLLQTPRNKGFAGLMSFKQGSEPNMQALKVAVQRQQHQPVAGAVSVNL